jgi:hypothetical protein
VGAGTPRTVEGGSMSWDAKSKVLKVTATQKNVTILLQAN